MTSLDVRAIDAKTLTRAPAPKTQLEFRVYLAEEAFDRAVARGDGDTTREIGGVLVGEVLRDDAGPYLRIDDTIDALHAEEKGAELTFTHATWEHVHQQMDSTHKGKHIVGWYHTHPGFGVFLSDRDQFIHKSFFNLPFQVALVYDPKSREHGLFTWRDNEVWRARRFWIGPREQLWDGPRAGEPARPEAQGAGAEPKTRAPARADDEGLSGNLGVLGAIAVVLMLAAGFVGHWIGAASANQALVEAQAEIAKGRMAGAQAALASLDGELVALLRDTLGDAAVRTPVAAALAELDGMIANLDAPAGLGNSSDPRVAQASNRLKILRTSLARLAEDRGSAQAVLAALERSSRRGGYPAADLSRDVVEQRAGLGGLYAEMALDAVKAGDPARARRLLGLAAHFDPANQPRYEKQLQSFDPKARLPREGASPVAPAAPGVSP